jgi:hypothetical protein
LIRSELRDRVGKAPMNAGKRGYHRVGMRHGVSTVTAGQRTAMGLIFHDAK